MESIYWESTMEFLIQEYRTIDGVNIAHGGHTCVSLFRFGESSETHSRTRMEEVWTIEEVDINIKGLSMDCFLPPSDLVKKDKEGCDAVGRNIRVPFKARLSSGGVKISSSKVVSVEDSDSTTTEEDDEDEKL